MKLSFPLLLLAAAIVLAGCNFTLAEDIPPPPDYVPPTPMPTLGALYPASAPDVQKGAAIFAKSCAPCHGATGLGDGPQSMQLPVTVPGIGLPEKARGVAPADWFKVVTQGNIDRYMPPFVGALSDQERWDVVAYALTLHTTADEIARGRSLVEADCPQCAPALSDQTRMSALSETELVRIIREGDGDIPPFARDYSDEDAYAAAAHLRSLAFAGPVEVAAPATPSAQATGLGGTPQVEGTPSSTTEVPPAAGIGSVSGTVQMSTPGKLQGLTVTLRGYDHGVDQATGPQEVLKRTAAVAADGTYVFEDVEMPNNGFFQADVDYAGINYESDIAPADSDATAVSLPPVQVFESSTDLTLLTLEQLHVYTDFATDGSVQFLEVFAFSNTSDKAVVISTDGTTVSFIQFPEGAISGGLQEGQDSTRRFVAADDGVAVVPNDIPYSIIAFFSLPYERALQFAQPMVIDAPSVLLLVPDGIRVSGDQFASEGLQVIQDNNYQEFSAANLKPGETMSFTITGRPKISSATGWAANRGWLIGGGALGLALILGGVYLYLRDRRRESADMEEPEFEAEDEVLDAILALDDLHRAGKISDSAHKARRDELKDILRKLR